MRTITYLCMYSRPKVAFDKYTLAIDKRMAQLTESLTYVYVHNALIIKSLCTTHPNSIGFYINTFRYTSPSEMYVNAIR
jgi:hypothetical protein